MTGARLEFGGEEFSTDLATKTAVLASWIIRNQHELSATQVEPRNHHARGLTHGLGSGTAALAAAVKASRPAEWRSSGDGTGQ